MRLAGLGAAVFVLTAATVATATGWPDRLPLHLTLYIAAGLSWAGALALLGRIGRGPRDRLVIVGVAVALRLCAWPAAPAHSDDVYRYAWDGQVTIAGINPYRFAPAAPELARLRGATPTLPDRERGSARPAATDGGTLSSRINNPDLPTIYPPASQLLFALAALLPLPPVASLKLLLGACDLLVLWLLLRLLDRRGHDPRHAIAWAWSPLVVIELSQNAHLEALPIAGLVAALLLWESGRRGAAGAALGAAAAAKLITLPLLPAFRSRRTWVSALGCAALFGLPFLAAGPAIGGSTGEFARRWRSNDGAYALIQGATDRLVCRALNAPRIERAGTPCDRPLDLWPHVRLAALISRRPQRAAVYPDELSAFAARAFTGLLLAGVGLAVLCRKRSPVDGCEWILGALLLLTPALHPWYATWLLPLAALTRRRAFIALAALVPLGYLPLAGWLAGAPWKDPVWTRVVLHGVCWGLLALDALRAPIARSLGGRFTKDFGSPGRVG
ncbi:MAG: DUF2029 domain-containing protein [Myxococcales bacterium]|nr:DUF2029 domain-containing protein [Myxococcales bacterium]